MMSTAAAGCGSTTAVLVALLAQASALAGLTPGAQRVKYFNQTLVIMEGENFTTSQQQPAAWSSRAWADGGNLFASDGPSSRKPAPRSVQRALLTM